MQVQVLIGCYSGSNFKSIRVFATMDGVIKHLRDEIQRWHDENGDYKDYSLKDIEKVKEDMEKNIRERGSWYAGDGYIYTCHCKDVLETDALEHDADED